MMTKHLPAQARPFTAGRKSISSVRPVANPCRSGRFTRILPNGMVVDRECRSCTADRKLLSRYGLTRHEFNALLESQHGRCAICQELPVGESLNVDHCHASGRVRALLCRGCNTAIGLLGDDPGKIRAAAFYIESFSSQAFAA